MPIKEIIAISALVMASIVATNPLYPQEAIRNFKLRVLREVGRTDNWGNPSIFKSSRTNMRRHLSHAASKISPQFEKTKPDVP